RDAADAAAVDEAELSAASDVERALAPGAPVIWPEAPDNVALDWTDGDAAAVEMACARAAHVERVRLLDTRLAPAALEPRAAIGQWDAVSGRYTLIAGTQGVAAGGRILALRVRTFVGIGAYTSTFSAIFATNNTKNCLSSVYEVPLIQIDVKMVLTNAAPLGPYRGAGRPEALYLIERLLDGA